MVERRCWRDLGLGDFFLTFQKKPKTVLDLTMEMQGKKAEYWGMTFI